MDESLCARRRKRNGRIEATGPRAPYDTLRNQHMTLNSSGSGRPASAMRPLQGNAPSQRRFGQGVGLDRSRRLKTAEVGNGSSGRSAAEWTVPEITMPPRLVRITGLSMVPVRRRWQL